MKLLLFLVITLTLFAQPASAAGRKQPKRSPLLPEIQKPTEPANPGKIFTTSIGGKDLRFLSDAIEYGLGQVFLASLATSGAQSDRVKALADVLSQTQREENSKLSRLAALKEVALGDREAAAQENFMRKFAKMSPDKFDAAWVEEIVTLNEKAVANFTEASESTDSDIKIFAQKALLLAQEKLTLVTGRGAPKVPKFRTDMSQPAPR